MPNPANSQSWNRYSYVSNNPLRYTDPSGHMQVEDSYASSNGTCKSGDTSCNWVGKSKDKTKKNDKGVNKKNDNGPITELILSLPFSADVYNHISTGLDVSAWMLDAYSAGVVTYGGIYGAGIAAPFIPGGAPEVPVVTGIAGMGIAELAVQPVLNFANFLALGSTAANIISDTKTGNTRLEQGQVSTSVANSISLTSLGFANKEAYVSFILQSTAVANDFGWTSIPWH